MGIISWFENILRQKQAVPLKNSIHPEITKEVIKLYNIITKSFIKNSKQRWIVLGGKNSRNKNRLIILEETSDPNSTNKISIDLLLFSEQHKLQLLVKVLSGSKVISEKNFRVTDQLSEEEIKTLSIKILDFLNYEITKASFKN
ncbi:MAG: hypothetical protein PHF86_11125 [Candidatus Nanoarchaeia archaeon]|nr:hypothetical protein [Candidatus Nanoarchaeia archaeon]